MSLGGEDMGNEPPVDMAPRERSLVLEVERREMQVGEAQRLRVFAEQEGTQEELDEDVSLTFTLSPEGLLEREGLSITGLEPGEVQIKACLQDDASVCGQTSVIVKEDEDRPTALSVSPPSLVLVRCSQKVAVAHRRMGDKSKRAPGLQS